MILLIRYNVTTNAYDEASRQRVVSDRTNAATYSYIATNRLVGQIHHAASGIERMVTRKHYDGLNRLTGIGSSNGVLGQFEAALSAYNLTNQHRRFNAAAAPLISGSC